MLHCSNISFLNLTNCEKCFQIPMVAELYISENAALKPVKRAVDLLGSVVIPGSSLIVGGRLYAFRNAVSGQKCVGNGSKLRFQTISGMMILGLVLTRFVILGFAGRIAFKILGFSYFVHDPLLRIYMIFPYFMPTASNIVVMVQMAGGNLPNVGDRMEHALLTLMFWQYVTAPLFLSANVALDIVLAYGERGM